MGRLAQPTQADPRLSLEADFDQLGDTLRVAGRATLPLGPIQLKAKGSQRVFLDITDAGRARHAQMTGAASLVAAEIGRAFLSNRRHYGSLGIEFSQLLPVGDNFIGLLIHTGTYESADLPWTVNFTLQLRFRLTGNESNLILDGSTEKVLWTSGSNWLRLGAGIGWAQRLKDGPGPSATEHAVLTLGPQATWNNALGEWKVRLSFRLWLDRDPAPNVTSYLSEFDLPAATAFWTLRF